MADRFPLILNTSANQIQEIGSGDTLDLTGSNIKGVGIITATNLSGNIIAGAGTSNIVSGILTAVAADIDDFVDVGSNIQLGNAGVITATTFKGDGDFVELDVDGHTNLDNLSVAGVSTFAGNADFSAGIDVTGTITGTSHVDLPDAAEIKLGDNDEFLIYHTATGTSYIKETGSGDLYIDATNIRLRSQNGNEKLATTSTGVSVTGNATVSGNLSVGGVLTYEDVTNVDSIGIITARNGITVSSGTATFQGAIDANGDLDVDGHTNLDNVSVAGVSTYTGAATFNGSVNSNAALNIGANSHITLATGNWAGDAYGKIQHHANRLYLGAGSNPDPSFVIRYSGSDRIYMTSGGTFYPTNDSSSDLGKSSVRWANVYADTLYGDGSNLTGLNTDLVNDTSPQLGGPLNTNTQIIKFPDSNGSTNQAVFGTGNDLKIYHQSNSSYIINATGNLNIGSNNEVRIKGGSDVAESMAIFKDNGAVELYYDNVKHFETISAGLNFCGSNTDQMQWQKSNNLLKFRDGTKAVFGEGDDLQIYGGEGGTGAVINSANGDLFFRHGSEEQLILRDDGAVELYYDAAKKFETLSTGCTIFGNGTQGKLTIGDTGDVDLILAADSDNADESHNPTIHFLQDGGNTYLKIGVEGGNGQTLTNSTGNCPYVCTTQSLSLQLGSNSTIRWEISGSGAFRPIADNTYDIGTTGQRVRNIYVNDLQLSNKAKKDEGGNDVDGTWGDFTIQEGESDLYLINNRNGKKYKFNLTEVS